MAVQTSHWCGPHALSAARLPHLMLSYQCMPSEQQRLCVLCRRCTEAFWAAHSTYRRRHCMPGRSSMGAAWYSVVTPLEVGSFIVSTCAPRGDGKHRRRS